MLLQSSQDEEWWADSMECRCYLRNIQDLLSDWKTPNDRRFGIPFHGPVIPFGAMVEYHPISDKDLSRLHQFSPKVLPGTFLGHVLDVGGIWKGDVLVADIEELQQMDASENYAKRLHAKEVLTPMSGEKVHIPIRRWNSKTLWNRSGSENIPLLRDRPDRGDEQGNLQEGSDGSSSTPLRGAGLGNGHNHTHAKHNFSGNTKELAKFLEPKKKPKIIHTNKFLGIRQGL